MPVCFAALLALLFLPLSRWLETKGISKGPSILICLLVLIAVVGGLLWLLSWQLTDLGSSLTDMDQKLRQAAGEFKKQITEKLGVSTKQVDNMVQKQQSSGKGAASVIANVGSSIFGFLVDTVLVFVYIFLFLYYRSHLKKFVFKLVNPQNQKKAADAMHKIQKVAQQYLAGMGMMIVALWILYGIGFSIIGVKHFLIFAILCGLLEIVPFVGNLTGNLITILMVLAQGGGSSMVLGVVITYAIVQFLQTYLLEPLVVGAEVNINPLFTIMVIVVGELVWGIPGMVLAIPLLGIVKIICDNVEPLRPYGFLIGKEKKSGSGWIDKMKKAIKK